MGKLKFGVSSIILGKEQKTENLKYDSVEWGEATTIRDFSAREEIRLQLHQQDVNFCIQQKSCLFCLKTWKKKSSYLERRKYRYRANSKTKRSSRSCTFRKRVFKKGFCSFHSKRDGSSSAFVEKGMTYLSGDQAYLGEGKDQGEKRQFRKSSIL